MRSKGYSDSRNLLAEMTKHKNKSVGERGEIRALKRFNKQFYINDSNVFFKFLLFLKGITEGRSTLPKDQ